ncbi:MAG: hypothetical protein ACREYF_05465 [Gammaproteobacteria bacterium]
MAARVRTKRRREALVYGHLERVSRELLEDHFEVVKRFIGRNAGIYALYRKDRLCYIGLASALSSRLKHHVNDHLSGAWDRFSIYLTIKDQHLKEIESLLLRIARPSGNKLAGRTARSRDLRKTVAKAIREKQKKEVQSLFARLRRHGVVTDATVKADEQSELMRLLPQGARLRGTLKKATYRATALRDGRVRYDGVYYKSLSAAAIAAVKRPTNGWWFWAIERSRGDWVRLTKFRKAGTPFYLR